MEHNSETDVMTFDKSELSKCMLCADPPCTGVCPQHADVANILKSMFFRNYIGAVRKLDCDCTYCNAPCEKACVLNTTRLPVGIREILLKLKHDSGILPANILPEVDICGDIILPGQEDDPNIMVGEDDSGEDFDEKTLKEMMKYGL